MGVPTGRKWIALSLLAVVLLVSLLATLKLTGILAEPPPPEIIILDEVRWQVERPSKYARIGETVKSTYTDYAIAVNTSVSIHRYYENGLSDPYWNRDGVPFRVSTNATIQEGFIASIVVEFLSSDVNFVTYVNPTFARYHNARVTRIEGIDTSTGVTYIEVEVSGSPCSMRLPLHWVFTDQNLEDHCLTVNVGVTHFDGTTYRKIVAPVILEMPIST